MASVEPFIGEIGIFTSFVPRGWLPCDGSLLSVSQYSALFSVIGTTYGGNGTSTFAVPDLRDSVPMGTGSGPGLSSVVTGQRVGADSVALTNNQTAHSHSLSRKGSSSVAQKTNSVGASTNLGQLAKQYDVPGNQWELVPHFAAAVVPNTSFDNASIGIGGGGGAAHENRQPFLGLQYAIALDGLYPPRP